MSKEALNVVSNEPVELGETGEQTKSEQKATQESAEDAKDAKDAEDANEHKETQEDKDAGDKEEDLPPPPPRPVSPVTKMKNELKEAFPTMSDRVITGILIASLGQLDQAFNACLYISDESIEEPEINLNPQTSLGGPPPVPSKSRSGSTTNDSGLTDDELLARKLQKEFEMEERRRRKKHQQRERRKFNDQVGDDSGDEFENFKDSFNQGLEEARTTLNGWVSGLTKSFNGNNQEQQYQQPQQRPQNRRSGDNPKLFGALGGSSFQRRSNSGGNRFDEDPKILPNDFHQKISLSNNEGDEDDSGPALPRRKGNDTAGDGANAETYAGDKKNWQSLNSDVPVNSDAFIVTDSEDEDKKDTIKL